MAEPVLDQQVVADDVVVTDAPVVVTAELTEEQVLNYLSSKGIKTTDFETLKQKAEYVPPAAGPTDEQKAAQEKELEKRLVGLYMDMGGSAQDFAHLQSIVASDSGKIGFDKVVSDLKKEGFTDEDAVRLAKEMHFDIPEDELSELEADAKEALLKKKAFGQKKQASRGDNIKKSAQSVLDTLKQKVAQLDTEKQKEEQHLSKVEDALKVFPRKLKLELGKLADADIDPIDFETSEAAISKVKDAIKSYPDLKKQLFTETGEPNLEFILPLLAKSFSFDEAVKASYLTGIDRNTKILESKYSPTSKGIVTKPVKAAAPVEGAPKFKSYGKAKLATQNN